MGWLTRIGWMRDVRMGVRGLLVVLVLSVIAWAQAPATGTAAGAADGQTMSFVGYGGAADDATTPGFHKLIFRWQEDGQTKQMPFSVYLPHGYAPDDGRQWPMLTFLGGLGDRGSDPTIAMGVGVPLEIGRNYDLQMWMPMIVLTPQCPYDKVWDTPGMGKTVMRLVRAASERFHVDVSREYVTGFSDGGKGSWVMAFEAPDFFAVTAPVVSREFQAEEMAKRLAGSGITCLVISGLADPKSEPASKVMVDAMGKQHVDAVYAPVPNGQHFIWQAFYCEQSFYEFLLAHQRGKPKPTSRMTGEQFVQLYQARQRSNVNELVFDHQLQRQLDQFEPYWFVDNCARFRPVGFRMEVGNRQKVFITIPMSQEIPCRLQTTRQLAADGWTELAVEVGHPGGSEWELVVRVNEQEQTRTKVNDRNAPDGWMRITVSLKPWAGKEARLQLVQYSTGKSTPAYWSSVKLVEHR